MNTPAGKYALVRQVSDSYSRCIQPEGAGPIDVKLARGQHAAYRAALEDAGLELIVLEADERYPDGCFVEDTAVIAGDLAVILPVGAPSRVGEADAVQAALAPFKRLAELKPPASLDGGDILKIDDQWYVGMSERSNQQAVSGLNKLIQPGGFKAKAVSLEKVLHLKSACSYLGGGWAVVWPGCFDAAVLRCRGTIEVPDAEAYSANCLAVNGRVLVSRGYPRTRSLIEKAGFKTVELDMSEFRKGWGSLTCLSIIF